MGQRTHLLVMRILIVADWLDTIVARVERYDILRDEYSARLVAQPLNHSMIDQRDITLARVGDRMMQGPPARGRGDETATTFGAELLARRKLTLGAPELWKTIAWVWPVSSSTAEAVEVPQEV